MATTPIPKGTLIDKDGRGYVLNLPNSVVAVEPWFSNSDCMNRFRNSSGLDNLTPTRPFYPDNLAAKMREFAKATPESSGIFTPIIAIDMESAGAGQFVAAEIEDIQDAVQQESKRVEVDEYTVDSGLAQKKDPDAAAFEQVWILPHGPGRIRASARPLDGREGLRIVIRLPGEQPVFWVPKDAAQRMVDTIKREPVELNQLIGLLTPWANR